MSSGSNSPASSPITRPKSQFAGSRTDRYGEDATGRYGEGATGRYGEDATGRYGEGATGRYGDSGTGRCGKGEVGRYGECPMCERRMWLTELAEHATACQVPYRYSNNEFSVADPGCLSRIRLFSIPDPGSDLFPSRIPDPHQRI